MADIRAKGQLTVGRDLNMADRGGMVSQNTQTAGQGIQTAGIGGQINPSPPIHPKRENPILGLLHMIIAAGRKYLGKSTAKEVDEAREQN